MTQVTDGELQELRRRAYGPRPDIDDDPAALARLRQLEAEQAPRIASAPSADRAAPAADPDLGLVRAATESDVELLLESDPPPARESAVRVALVALARRIRRLRRSTVLIALVAALAVTAFLVVLTVVQRVQVDPLQTGATQVARLQPDPDFRLPSFFFGISTEGEAGVTSFDEFHGFRAVVSDDLISDGAICILVFSAADVADPQSEIFDGNLFSACSAGDFPAMVQFTTDGDSMPVELTSALPDSDAVQFVYDEQNGEVVVFAD